MRTFIICLSILLAALILAASQRYSVSAGYLPGIHPEPTPVVLKIDRITGRTWHLRRTITPGAPATTYWQRVNAAPDSAAPHPGSE
jgi:hypothetical protein